MELKKEQEKWWQKQMEEWQQNEQELTHMWEGQAVLLIEREKYNIHQF